MLMVRILMLLLTALSFSADKDSLQMKRADDKVVQSISIDRSKLEEIQQDQDHMYKPMDIEKNFLEKISDWISEKWQQFLEWTFGEKKGSELFIFFIEYFPYLLLFIAILIIIRLLYGYDVFKRLSDEQRPPRVQLSDDEQVVKSANISQHVHDAIENKAFRSAIRYMFLNTLRQLDLMGHINYVKNKTNDDYVHEIKRDRLKQTFQELEYYYDFIWYGQYPIDEPFFRELQAKFDGFQEQLNNKAA